MFECGVISVVDNRMAHNRLILTFPFMLLQLIDFVFFLFLLPVWIQFLLLINSVFYAKRSFSKGKP